MPNKNSKRIFSKIVLITLILIAIVTGAYFSIRSNRAKEEVKNLIISKLEDIMEREIYIGKVKNYTLQSVTLSDFKIFQDKSLKDEDLLFESDEIIVNYDLDIFSALSKKTPLNIEDITLVKPKMTLIRDSQGVFDFMEKFNFYRDYFKFSIRRVNIKDGNLLYKDYYKVTKEDGLFTRIKSVNGYFYLGDLPRVEFDCSGLRVEDSTPLTLKGYFFVDGLDYSLDFVFRDADITHFQYYFVQAKPFNFKKGLFDLDLHLANDLNTTQDKAIWHGQASVKDVDLSPDFLDGLEIEQAEGSVTFDCNEIILKKATAVYKNSPFALTGNLHYVDDFNYDIQVKSGDFRLSDLKEGLKKLLSIPGEYQAEGKSNLSFEVRGVEENFQVQGELLTEQGKIQGYDFSNLKTEFHYDQDDFYFENMKVDVGEGIIEGTGKLSLKDELPEYDILFDLTQIDVKSDFLKALSLDYLSQGLLSGKVEIKGNIGSGEKVNLFTEIKVEDETEFFSLNAEGIIAENNYLDLKVKTIGIDLEELGEILNYQGIKGIASFSGNLQGLLNDLKITGKIEIEKGQIYEVPFDYLEGEINYQDNKLQLEEVIFKNKDLAFKGKGNINLLEEENISIDLVLQIEEANLHYLANFYNYDLPVLGLAQGEISLQGNLPQVIINGDLQLKDINLVSYKAESGNLVFSLEDNKIKIKSLVLNSGRTQVYTQGEINLDQDSPLNLRVNFLNQDVPDLLSNFIKSDLIDKFRGQATGSFEVKGDFNSPDLYLSAIIGDAQLDEIPLNSIEIKLEKINSILRFNTLKLSQRKGELVAGGWINFDEENKKLNLNISAKNIDLNQFSNILGWEEEIKGLVNFKATATGNIELPKITLSADIKKGEFQDFTFDNLKVEALYDQEFLEVKQFILDKEGYQIKGHGKIPYEFSFMEKEKRIQSLSDIPVDFTLSLENTDLSFIKIFFKEDIKQLRGLTNIELVLSGTLNQPILNGNIILKDGLIELYELPVKVSDINTLLQIEDNLVKIEDINFKINQYQLYALGEFKIKDLQPHELSINIWSDNEEIIYQDIFKANTNVNLNLTSDPSFPSVRGIFTISEGELDWRENKEAPFNLSELMSAFKLNSIETGSLDIEIKILDEFVAKTKDFNLKTTGNLYLQGNLADPQLNGELGIKQGHIAFLDKKFRILSGRVIFSNFLGRNVILDIEAKTEIDNIDVFLQVGGDILQPSVTLSSSPVLSENEIISLLMFNKNYAGLNEGELGTILREEMIYLIAQGLSVRFLNQIENQVANSLGLDEFKIETIFKKDEDSNTGFLPGLTLEGLALKFGKYFTENFYLTYSAPLYEAGKGNIGLEYKISDDLTFSTQIGEFSPQDNDFEFKVELKYGF